MDWGVELLRLSLFSPGSVSIADADWEAVTGQKEAETRQVVVGGRRHVGNFAGGSLTMQAIAQRLDLVLSQAQVVPSELQEGRLRLPVIGAWMRYGNRLWTRLPNGWNAAPFQSIALRLAGFCFPKRRIVAKVIKP